METPALLWTPNVRGADMLLMSPWPRDVRSFANSPVRILFSAGMAFRLDVTNDCLSACCSYLQKGPPVPLDLPV